MPSIEELNDKIRVAEKKIADAEQKLIVLAKQNTEYNAEIVNLKELKAKAIADYGVAISDLERAVNAVSIKQSELDRIISDIEKQKSELTSASELREKYCADAFKEKNALAEALSRLRLEKSSLEAEVASLQNKVFNSGVTLNTQTFSISENEQKINRLKSELSNIERQLNVSKMELNSVEEKKKEALAEMDAKASILADREKELTASVKNKEEALKAVIAKIENEQKSFNADVETKNQELKSERISLDKVVEKNDADAKANATLRQALDDRERELKLLELKIKELARKKDIDVQIASLSK